MSRSNYDKPFYVDVGTSIVAIRCASDHDVVFRYDHALHPSSIELAEAACDRINKEAEIGRPRRNCDVGTAKEQEDRFNKYCRGSNYCAVCPIRKLWDFQDGHIPSCTILWSQMPYNEDEYKKEDK